MQDRRLAANEIATKLIAAEAAIDAAIAAVAALNAQMPVASMQANVGPHVLHQALMHSMESCQQLVKSRSNIIRTHSALRDAQDAMGMGSINFAPVGFAEFCGPAGESTSTTPRAHLVAVAA